jgi:hypothetical protein
MNRLQRMVLFGVLVLAVLVLVLGSYQSALAGANPGYGGGPPPGQGNGVEPPYGPPGYGGGGCNGNCDPGWGGSQGNRGPHGP